MKNKINTESFSQSDVAFNTIPTRLALVGSHRRFKEYFINDTGILFATSEEVNQDSGEEFFNTKDILNTILNLGAKAHEILKDELIAPRFFISSSNNTDVSKVDDEVSFIDFYKVANDTLGRKYYNNSFVDNFIPQNVLNKHINELSTLVLDFCKNNGMPNIEGSEYLNTGRLCVNPLVKSFCKKENINYYGDKITLDYRIIKFCKDNKILLLDTTKFHDNGSLYINPIVLRFCKDNNIPYDSLKGRELDYRVVKFCEENNLDFLVEDFICAYYCHIKSFISLSIIIYILFETQDIIKHILEHKAIKPTFQEDTIGFIMNSGKDGNWKRGISTYLNRLDSILWFFYEAKKIELKEIKIYELVRSLLRCIKLIDNETSYIIPQNYYDFPPYLNKFIIREKHTNLLSIAWSELKISTFSDKAIRCATPGCKNAFEPTSSSQIYCEACIYEGKNKKVNSNKSYAKKQKLYDDLVKLYHSADVSKLNKLSKKTKDELKRYVSYTKATEIKGNTTVTSIKSYINLLNNLK